MAKKRAKRRTVKRKTKRKSSGRRGSGLTKMTCCVSPALEAIVGTKKATRPQIVKKLWAYIKSHKCQDSKRRRMINPDHKLAAVLGSRPIDMMKMAGCLSKHIRK